MGLTTCFVSHRWSQIAYRRMKEEEYTRDEKDAGINSGKNLYPCVHCL